MADASAARSRRNARASVRADQPWLHDRPLRSRIGIRGCGQHDGGTSPLPRSRGPCRENGRALSRHPSHSLHRWLWGRRVRPAAGETCECPAHGPERAGWRGRWHAHVRRLVALPPDASTDPSRPSPGCVPRFLPRRSAAHPPLLPVPASSPARLPACRPVFRPCLPSSLRTPVLWEASQPPRVPASQRCVIPHSDGQEPS